MPGHLAMMGLPGPFELLLVGLLVLCPLCLLCLAGLAVWLVSRGKTSGGAAAPASGSGPDCGRPWAADYKFCPECGRAVGA